ncbi:MAG: class I SAM-dependent methyltransferase [Negativicoccus succinicivorans]|nr:class I SAM-dependent methyltransferase [Negativicoccus succinicivorans]
MIWGITTGYKPTDEQRLQAQKLASEWQLPYVERGHTSLRRLAERTRIFRWLVQLQRGLVATDGKTRLEFHLQMAKLRALNWERKRQDHFADLLHEVSPKRFLDATFGRGSDAIMAAYTLPENVQIIALEKSFPVYAVGREGLRSMKVSEAPALTAALRRIHLLHVDVNDYLKKQPDNHFDVIYFDFMFHHTVSQTNNLSDLRIFAAQSRLDEILWEDAKRVAKKRIIVKNRPFASWFKMHRRRFYEAVRIVEWFTGYGTYETTPGSYYGTDGGG